MSLPQNVEQGKTNYARPAPNAPPSAVCSVITGSGRSAIAVVALRGSGARDMLAQCFRGATKAPFSAGEIRFGAWHGPGDSAIAPESVVVTPIDDERFEIHCHGGPAATARILEDLAASGARVEQAAWDLDERPLLIREAAEVLSRCLTARTAAIAMDQMRGGLAAWATASLAELHRDSTSVEAARASAAAMRHSTGAARLGKPFRVVLVGPPNVGKSSLVNAIIGFDRSITLDSAGTTRDVLHAETVIDGIPVRLSDTAGLREGGDAIEQQGIERARSAAESADLLLCVTEPALGRAETAVPEGFRKPMIRVLNKADLLDTASDPHAWDVTTSTISGQGIEDLMRLIATRLEAELPAPGQGAPLNQRQADLLDKIARSGDSDEVIAALEQLLGNTLSSDPPPR